MNLDLLLRREHQPDFLHAGARVGAEFRTVVVVAADADFDHQFGGVRVVLTIVFFLANHNRQV